jgi:hypothetical protein
VPPAIPGLRWNPTRAVYELDEGADGRGDPTLLAVVARRAADGVFMQAYPADEELSGWRFRWVRVQTAEPQRGAPYIMLGDVESLDRRPQAAVPPSTSGNLLRKVAANDAIAAATAKQGSSFDVSVYEYVGIHHKSGSIDRMVYHLEPRKDLPPDRQEELWEALCTSPDVPAQHRLSPEDCQVRRWFREAQLKMK